MKMMLPEQIDNSEKAKDKLHEFTGSVPNIRLKKMSTKISSYFMQNKLEKNWYANWFLLYGCNKRN